MGNQKYETKERHAFIPEGFIEHLDTCMQSIASMNYFVNVLLGKNKDSKG
jgi:hypothetical protein